jgi:hypothetical protein
MVIPHEPQTNPRGNGSGAPVHDPDVDTAAEREAAAESQAAEGGNGQKIPPGAVETQAAEAPEPSPRDAKVTPLQPGAKAVKSQVTPEERAALDEAEALAADALLDDEDEDAPGDKDELSQPLVVKKLPRFVSFRANEKTFDLWGTSDQQGMDELLFVTTKKFAPNFEEDIELQRIRFFETVTPDGVVRLVWCKVPEKSGRQPNSWQTSKLAALEHAQKRWTTMRSRSKLAQYTFRPSIKQDHPPPRFSGRTPEQWVLELKKLDMLVVSKDHAFFKKATDTE